MILYHLEKEPISNLPFDPKLVYVSNVYGEYGMKHPRALHKHEEQLEILFVYEGSGFYLINNKKYAIRAGDIFICNAKVLHEEVRNKDSNFSLYCACFEGVEIDGLPKNCLTPLDACPVISSAENFHYMKSIMENIFGILTQDVPSSSEICNHLSKALFIMLLNTIKTQVVLNENLSLTEKDKLVLHVREYIDNNFNQNITLDIIAKTFDVSPYYLAHIFKESMDCSLMQYVIRRRIGEAQSLLISSDEKISFVASEVGYGTISNFNIAFMRNVGMSPSQFRRTYIKK